MQNLKALSKSNVRNEEISVKHSREVFNLQLSAVFLRFARGEILSF